MSTTTEKKQWALIVFNVLHCHSPCWCWCCFWFLVLFLSFGGSGPSYSCFPLKFLFKDSEVFLRTILSYLVKDLALENFVFPHIFGGHQKY